MLFMNLITYFMMQKRLMFALYTVKSNETNLVPREIHKPSFSSRIIAAVSFFNEWKSCWKSNKNRQRYIHFWKMNMDHLLNKPYVNEVASIEHNLYQKSCLSSQLKLRLLGRLRSFQKGTVGLCRSIGCKVTSFQSWRMILLSKNRTQGALVWFDLGRGQNFMSNLQL